jgi:hypothetical protein
MMMARETRKRAKKKRRKKHPKEKEFHLLLSK